jgi:hypothetical protein
MKAGKYYDLRPATKVDFLSKNAKTILQFGGAVSKSIKLNKFDDAFIPDKEETK